MVEAWSTRISAQEGRSDDPSRVELLAGRVNGSTRGTEFISHEYEHERRPSSGCDSTTARSRSPGREKAGVNQGESYSKYKALGRMCRRLVLSGLKTTTYSRISGVKEELAIKACGARTKSRADCRFLGSQALINACSTAQPVFTAHTNPCQV